MTDYLQRILRARVYDVAEETPLDYATNLSRRLDNSIWLKREDLQPVFSFKLRGAYNRMRQLSPTELKQGVIASSAGNHAQGVALSASRLGCRAVIVMPRTTPEVKVRAVRALGGEVVLHGETYDECFAEAQRRCQHDGLTFIHPFDDPEVIAGQGTIGLEIMRQSEEAPHSIYIAVGGGGLIGGIAAYIKTLWPEIEIVGVEPIDAAAMTRSLEAGERVELSQVGLFADGVAVRKVGEQTFSLAQRHIDRMVNVDTDAICAAIKDVFEDTRSILEPAGALAIAGLKQDVSDRGMCGQRLVAVACGANMNFDRLRFISERAELGEEREAMLAVEIPEQAGSLRTLCEELRDRSLTEFSYRMTEGNRAQIFIGLQVQDEQDRQQLVNHLCARGFPCLDLSDNEFAKVHLRHMVGGRLPASARHACAGECHELLYRFEFPERPGALMNFVSALHPSWSISIFHYRNHGADVGSIVVGLLVPQQDLDSCQKVLDELGFPYWDESGNLAYTLFL